MTRREKQFTAFFVEVSVPPTVTVTIVSSDKMAPNSFHAEWSKNLHGRVAFSQKAGSVTVVITDGGSLRLDASDPEVQKKQSSNGKEVTYVHRLHDQVGVLAITSAPNAPIWVGGLGPVSL